MVYTLDHNQLYKLLTNLKPMAMLTTLKLEELQLLMELIRTSFSETDSDLLEVETALQLVYKIFLLLIKISLVKKLSLLAKMSLTVEMEIALTLEQLLIQQPINLEPRLLN